MSAMQDSVEIKLKRSGYKVLSHPKTYALGSTVLLGDNEVVDDASECPTAYTNGRDKFYGREFCQPLTDGQMNYLVLHENGHVFKMDLPRHLDLIAEDARTFNIAADYVNNDIIESLDIWDLIERPPGCLIDPKFHNWSVRDVYRFLRTGRNKDGEQEGEPEPKGDDGEGNPTSVKIGNKEYPTESMDEHDTDSAASMTPEEIETLQEELQQVVQQAVLMAGVRGQDIPLQIRELLVPDVDWRAEMLDFLISIAAGNDEYTKRVFDRRYVADDHYIPTLYSEKAGEIILAMDASGSTMGPVFDEFCGALASILATIKPDRVRVLHWDTSVKHEQVLDNTEYDEVNLKDVLKPRGGGGTNVSRVSDYIIERGLHADCVLVMTDGWVESNPRWQVSMPTLWMVTQRDGWVPPAGRLVKIKK